MHPQHPSRIKPTTNDPLRTAITSAHAMPLAVSYLPIDALRPDLGNPTSRSISCGTTHFAWARRVVDGLRGVNWQLEAAFDGLIDEAAAAKAGHD